MSRNSAELVLQDLDLLARRDSFGGAGPLACGRPPGRPARTQEKPDQGVRRGRGRPPHIWLRLCCFVGQDEILGPIVNRPCRKLHFTAKRPINNRPQDFILPHYGSCSFRIDAEYPSHLRRSESRRCTQECVRHTNSPKSASLALSVHPK